MYIFERPESGPGDWDPPYSCPLIGGTDSLFLYSVFWDKMVTASRQCIHRLSAMVGQLLKVTSQLQI